MIRKRIFLLSTLTFWLSACGILTNSSTEYGFSPSRLHLGRRIQGIWRTECAQQTIELHFSNNSEPFAIAYLFSDSSSCSESNLAAISKTSLQYDAITVPYYFNRVHDFDVQINKVELLLPSATSVAGGNSYNLCGLTNWEVDKWKDVSRRDCGVLGDYLDVPAFQYNSIEVLQLENQNEAMWIGMPSRTPENRPKIPRLLYYLKQASPLFRLR